MIMNLLLFNCVMTLLLCIVSWTCPVMPMTSLLLVVRLRRLPIRPSLLRLRNIMLTSALAWGTRCRVAFTCLSRACWPDSWASGLRLVRNLSLCCDLWVLSTLMNRDMQEMGVFDLLRIKLTVRLI